MKNLSVGIFGESIRSEHFATFSRLLSRLHERGVNVLFYAPFEQLCRENKWIHSSVSTFASAQELAESCRFLISLGGDGTFLNAATLIGDTNIPIVGLNFGKLGFLAPIDTHFLEEALDDLCANHFHTEQRILLKISGIENLPKSHKPFALNDITFRNEGFGTFNLDVYINEQFLNTYFGDGLILSTPTGSTAYNLSCGGPILLPESQNFVLTPIASHALTVRPLVIPDSAKIEIRVNKSNSNIRVSLDSRQYTSDGEHVFSIEKAPFVIHTIRLHNRNFFDTLRGKLMWGQHARHDAR